MTDTISQQAGDQAIQIGGIGSIGTFNNFKLDNSHGGTVHFVSPESWNPPKLRPLPVQLAPRSFPLLLGRRNEIKSAVDALPYEQPINCYGVAGVGKTSFLRHLSHHPSIAPAFTAGIIYHRCNRYQGSSDILQILFNAFYESSAPVKLTDNEIRLRLQDKKTLIVLDDANLRREEVDALNQNVPNCTFLIASLERQLWGEGQALSLGGLSLEDSLTLVERELGYSLKAEERSAAESLCRALDGHPLKILQASALAREENRKLAIIAQQLTQDKHWVAQLLSGLDKPQRQIIALLAFLGASVALSAEHIANITQLSNTQTILEPLLRRNLVQIEGTRYGISSVIGEALQGHSDQARWMIQALSYFSNWAERQQSSPQRLLEELDAIMSVLDWAVRTGHWAEVLRLGKAIEGALAISGLWGMWAIVLNWLLQAAQQIGDRAIEAYALHQLGTRSLCLGEVEPAKHYLHRALRICQDILQDQAATNATLHNLNFLSAATIHNDPPSLPDPSPVSHSPTPPQRFPMAVGCGALLLLIFVGLLA